MTCRVSPCCQRAPCPPPPSALPPALAPAALRSPPALHSSLCAWRLRPWAAPAHAAWAFRGKGARKWSQRSVCVSSLRQHAAGRGPPRPLPGRTIFSRVCDRADATRTSAARMMGASPAGDYLRLRAYRPISAFRPSKGVDEGAYGKEYASEGDAEALRNDKDNDRSHRRRFNAETVKCLLRKVAFSATPFHRKTSPTNGPSKEGPLAGKF